MSSPIFVLMNGINSIKNLIKNIIKEKIKEYRISKRDEIEKKNI
jgi:hypothetical protein